MCLKLHIPLFANLLYQFDFSIDFSHDIKDDDYGNTADDGGVSLCLCV